MANLWDDIAKTIRDGVDTVVEKTEELTKIGKIRFEILNVKRNIEKKFSELGGRVYHLTVQENATDVFSDKEVKEVIESVKKLEQELDDKKSALEKVKTRPAPTNGNGATPKTEAKPQAKAKPEAKTTAKSPSKSAPAKKASAPKSKTQAKK